MRKDERMDAKINYNDLWLMLLIRRNKEDEIVVKHLEMYICVKNWYLDLANDGWIGFLDWVEMKINHCYQRTYLEKANIFKCYFA